MSNLKLPTLTYSKLDRLLGSKETKRIGYETYAYRGTDTSICITHHGTTIATVGSQDGTDFVSIDVHYASTTTTARQTKVLRDNGVPFGIAIRQGESHIVSHTMADGRWRESKEYLPYYGATWLSQDFGWARLIKPLDADTKRTPVRRVGA